MPCAKTLLIGPRPPPHGGISVHVSGIHRRLIAAGVECEILDTTLIMDRLRFARELASYAARGWTLHLHTNGHNRNSWILCGSRGTVQRRRRPNAPPRVDAGSSADQPPRRRKVIGFVCRLYSRVICVGPAIQEAAILAGARSESTELAPAGLAPESPDVPLNPQLLAWIELHQPLISTALFFRPEYGFHLLIQGLSRLQERYPRIGCLVMGSGEDRQKAEALVRGAGLENHVQLLGDVNHDMCLALIRRSCVFVRPALEDGDSMSVREALALGVPVVASRVGSRPPAVTLFNPGDVEDMLLGINLALTGSLSTEDRNRRPCAST